MLVSCMQDSGQGSGLSEVEPFWGGADIPHWKYAKKAHYHPSERRSPRDFLVKNEC